MQTDVFEVEAVSLMTVDKVQIGHYSATKGKCWTCRYVQSSLSFPSGALYCTCTKHVVFVCGVCVCVCGVCACVCVRACVHVCVKWEGDLKFGFASLLVFFVGFKHLLR